MEIRITEMNTNILTNETAVKDYVVIDGEWEEIGIELPEGDKNFQISNEFFNAIDFLYDAFGEILDLPEDSNDIEEVFPIYTASDKRKRKRGYIYDLNEKDGFKTRIILFAPKNYLPLIL